MAFITTFLVVLVFAITPGLLVVTACFLVGVVASLPILAVAAVTRLVSADPPDEQVECWTLRFWTRPASGPAYQDFAAVYATWG